VSEKSIDGTERLCIALYGVEEDISKIIGGSNAPMLHDAANKIAALEAELAAGKEISQRWETLADSYEGDLNDIADACGIVLAETSARYETLPHDVSSRLAAEKAAREALADKIEEEICASCNYYRSLNAPCKCGQLSRKGTNEFLRLEADRLRARCEELERASRDVLSSPCRHCGGYGYHGPYCFLEPLRAALAEPDAGAKETK